MGTNNRQPIWSSRRVQQVTIDADAPMIFHVDGEPVAGETRLRVRIHPGALRICVRPG